MPKSSKHIENDRMKPYYSPDEYHLLQSKMPRYMSLINFTDQGIKDVKNLPKRVQAAREAIEKTGGKLLDWNLTMGQYDVVAISEVPNDSAASMIA